MTRASLLTVLTVTIAISLLGALFPAPVLAPEPAAAGTATSAAQGQDPCPVEELCVRVLEDELVSPAQRNAQVVNCYRGFAVADLLLTVYGVIKKLPQLGSALVTGGQIGVLVFLTFAFATALKLSFIYWAVAAGTCGPVLVPGGFREKSTSERRRLAEEWGLDLSIVDFDLGEFPDATIEFTPPDWGTPVIPELRERSLSVTVTDPTDPASCTANFDFDLDGEVATPSLRRIEGRVADFGDFGAPEFVFHGPFGSIPPASVLSPIGIIDLLTNEGLLDELVGTELDDLKDIVEDKAQIAPGSASARRPYDPVNNPVGDPEVFSVGSTIVDFESDLPIWSIGDLIRSGGRAAVDWRQEVWVDEFFEPEWVDPSPVTITYEALSPGGVDRTFTPPRDIDGSLEARDNCDPDPRVELPIPDFLPIGTHQFVARAYDRVGNVSIDKTVVVHVVDTVTPDLAPLDPLGVTSPAGASSIPASSIDLLAPPFFDFADPNPTIDCFVSNALGTNESCATAELPIGESTVTWRATDAAGNQSFTTQRVLVRPEGVNTAAIAFDSAVTVAAGATATFPVDHDDPDADPLDLGLVTPPQLGSVDIELRPIFQTRFSLTGARPHLGSVTGHYHPISVLSENTFGTLVLPSGAESLIRYHRESNGPPTAVERVIATPAGFVPDLVTIDGALFDPQDADDLISLDRDAGGAAGVHRLWWPAVLGDDPVDVSSAVQNPVDLVRIGDHVGILDRRSTSTGFESPSSVVWIDMTGVPVGELRLAIDADTIDQLSSSGTDHLLAAEWSTTPGLAGRVEAYELTPTTTNDSPPSAAFSWTENLDDDLDLGTITGADSGGTQVYRYFTVDRNEVLLPSYCIVLDPSEPEVDDEPCEPPMELVGFATVIAIAASPGSDDFLVLDAGRLFRFDERGRALQSIDVRSPSGGNSVNRTTDVAVDPASGDVCLTRARAAGEDFSEISCFDASLAPTQTGFVRGDAYGMSFDALGRVWYVGTEGLGRFERTGDCVGVGPDEVSDEICVDLVVPGDFRDVAAGSGHVYATDVGSDRVFRFTEAGVPAGWIGACTGSTDCAAGATTGWTSSATPAGSGVELGQFTFRDDEQIQYGPGLPTVPRDGRIDVDDLGTIFVADHVEAFARVQGFSPSGVWVEVAQPSAALDDGLLSFLEMGEFTGVNDIAALGDEFFIAEGLPLQRVHVYDIVDIEQVASFDPRAQLTYIAPLTAGADSFRFFARDPFTAAADASQATIDVSIVEDFAPPTITCPDDLVAAASVSSGAPQLGDIDLNRFTRGATAESLAGGAAVLPAPVVTNDAPLVYPLGDTVVTFTATDAIGRTTTCAATVTIADNPPVFPDLADLVIEATGPLTAIGPLLTAPDAVDLVHRGPVTTGLAEADAALPVGTHDVEWTAINSRGIAASVTQRVEVLDSTPPTIEAFVPPSTVVASDGFSTTLAYEPPSAADAVSDAIVSCNPGPAQSLGIGIWEVQCIARDEAGNPSITTASIEIIAPDADGDGIADMVDAGDGFSDEGLGGTTSGRVDPSTSSLNGTGRATVFDAADSKLGVQIVGTSTPRRVTVCDGTLIVGDVGVTPRADPGEAGVPDIVVVTCDEDRASLLVLQGEATARVTVDDTAEVAGSVSGGNQLDINGAQVAAAAGNDEPIVLSGTVELTLDPGGSSVIGTDSDPTPTPVPTAGPTPVPTTGADPVPPMPPAAAPSGPLVAPVAAPPGTALSPPERPLATTGAPLTRQMIAVSYLMVLIGGMLFLVERRGTVTGRGQPATDSGHPHRGARE